MKFEKSAGAIIFFIENGKPLYLLMHYPTYWGFVKGIIEKDEGEQEAAIREAEEETGIKDLGLMEGFKEKQKWFFRFQGELKSKEATYFMAEAKTKDIKISKEHDSYKWCAYEEALQIMRVKANKKLLEKADKFIGEHLKQGTLL